MSHMSEMSLGGIHNFISRLSMVKALSLAFMCGVLTLFAFAPFNFWPIYILSITLMVWLIDGGRVKEKWRKSVFTRGWLFGAGFTLASLHWLAAPFLVEPEKHLIFIWMPLVLMPAGLGLLFGGAALLAGALWSKKPARIFVFVLCFSLFEYLRGVLFGGFPWNWPGAIWRPGEPVSQLAAIFGLFGLSVLTLLLAASPAGLADFNLKGRAASRIFPLFIGVIIFVSGWGWGMQRLSAPALGETLSVRLVDVEIPQDEKFPAGLTLDEFNGNSQRILRAYLSGMGDDFPDEPRLVVWPESPIPFKYTVDRDIGGLRALPLIQDPNALDAISERLGGRTLITGSLRNVRYDDIGLNEETSYNSLAVLTERSNFRGALAIYDKRRLVPFGELAAADFIPFGHAISGLLPSAMQRQASQGITPGNDFTQGDSLIELPSGEKVIPLICYEALFPYLTKDRREGADLIVNISLDHWFGGQIGPQQHFQNASYRSIEAGLPMVRSANKGISALVDAHGRQMNSNTLSFEEEGWTVIVKDVTVNMVNINTTFSRIGGTLLIITLSIIALFSCLTIRIDS